MLEVFNVTWVVRKSFFEEIDGFQWILQVEGFGLVSNGQLG